MALRSVLSQLTHRFTAPTASMQWMRSISTSNGTRQVDEATKDLAPGMPSFFDQKLSTPRELSTSLDPYVGRSIAVSNPNTAYKRLNSILVQNNVRRELRANRYYEKPNVARRRKNIERNRKLFGAMVGKKVALIMQMKQRGM
ncbi:hypothetical protein BD560DRAFT_362188 [Blakeslea trispora]|nr:hypothetical protein BD560DRAFT_362188 [Blakeslea trispora]